ncbi:MAG TPA: hypothetical protein VF155_11195 [Candidatus Dormibacteraeota bacterium]
MSFRRLAASNWQASTQEADAMTDAGSTPAIARDSLHQNDRRITEER